MEAIKKEYKEGKLVLGTKQTLKLLKDKKIKLVYLSSSAPKDLPGLFKNTEIKHLKINAIELGKSFGKNFPVTICGVRK